MPGSGITVKEPEGMEGWGVQHQRLMLLLSVVQLTTVPAPRPESMNVLRELEMVWLEKFPPFAPTQRCSIKSQSARWPNEKAGSGAAVLLAVATIATTS